jgi:small subunit ribosomal protein S21
VSFLPEHCAAVAVRLANSRAGDSPQHPTKIIRKQLKKKNTIMIIMPVKEGENIERALKKFKRKYERTGVLKELRRRQYFTKPSIAKREAMQRAIYVEHTYRQEE